MNITLRTASEVWKSDSALDLIIRRRAIRQTQRGAGLTEYALLVALVCLAAIVGVDLLGQKIADRFCQTGNVLDQVNRRQEIAEISEQFLFDKQLGDCRQKQFGGGDSP